MLPLVVDGRVKARVVAPVDTTEHRFTASDSLVSRTSRGGFVWRSTGSSSIERRRRPIVSRTNFWARCRTNCARRSTRSSGGRGFCGPGISTNSTAHAVEVIQRNAEAQVRLIEEVLDVSRIITGKMTLAMETVDVGAIVRATIDIVRPAMHAKRIRLEERIGETPPVLGDAHRLQQVFWNVLSNALKFTGSDGAITVSAAQHAGIGRVRDRSIREWAFVARSCRSCSIGFVRPIRRRREPTAGLGLGLAIVQHIVELHGGTVRAASAGEGTGATFTIQLPTADRSRMRRSERGSTQGADAARSVRLRLAAAPFSSSKIMRMRAS